MPESHDPLSSLLAAARAARDQAYAPYSQFRVGAAVRTTDGRVFSGCNVENASYGLTVCAERVAVWKAISEGAKGIAAVAVVTDAAEPAAPCGACRQVLAEFAADTTAVALGNAGDEVQTTTVGELLPMAFRLGTP